MYNGIAEYETIKAICNEVSIPVFANGDITSFESARSVMNYTGAAGIMVGRGAHGAPWIPGLIAQYLKTGENPSMPSITQQRNIVLTHLDDLHHFYGAFQGVRIARKHIKWYTENHLNSASFRAVFNRVETPQLQIGMASDYYNQLMESVEKASVWQKNLTNVRAAEVVKNKTSLRIA
jgi:tRNA-dihydrouridine synthase B